jgi:DNA-binding transcriptional MerR regulator
MTPPPPSPALLSIDELAARAEVSRRAIRYYIQRGLLPAPHGMGRGSHYSAEHLTRLIALKEAQREGRSLDEIAQTQERAALLPAPLPGALPASLPASLPDSLPGALPAPISAPLTSSPRRLHALSADPAEAPTLLHVERRLHVRCADGVELSVRAGALSLERLTALVALIQEHLDAALAP